MSSTRQMAPLDESTFCSAAHVPSDVFVVPLEGHPWLVVALVFSRLFLLAESSTAFGSSSFNDGSVIVGRVRQVGCGMKPARIFSELLEGRTDGQELLSGVMRNSH